MALILPFLAMSPVQAAARERIAVLDFDVRGAITESISDAGIIIADMIAHRLSAKYDVCERSQIKTLVEEHDLQASSMVDRTDAAATLGKLLGAKYVLLGRVSPRGKKYAVAAHVVDCVSGKVQDQRALHVLSDFDAVIAVEVILQQLGLGRGLSAHVAAAEVDLATESAFSGFLKEFLPSAVQEIEDIRRQAQTHEMEGRRTEAAELYRKAYLEMETSRHDVQRTVKRWPFLQERVYSERFTAFGDRDLPHPRDIYLCDARGRRKCRIGFGGGGAREGDEHGHRLLEWMIDAGVYLERGESSPDTAPHIIVPEVVLNKDHGQSAWIEVLRDNNVRTPSGVRPLGIGGPYSAPFGDFRLDVWIENVRKHKRVGYEQLQLLIEVKYTKSLPTRRPPPSDLATVGAD